MYQDFISRNAILISDDVQANFRNTKILLCGCGIGSYAAEALLRMGCINLTLIDMDTVSLTNLNRQNYSYNDVDALKVEALQKRLLSLYPEANVKAIPEPVSQTNVADLVTDADIVIDTIDFLDMKAIVLLHQEAYKQNKPIISAMSIGFGCGLFYIPGDHSCSLVSYLMNRLKDRLEQSEYKDALNVVLEDIWSHLDQDVQKMMALVIKGIEEKKPCPAMQVVAGSMSCASLIATCVEHILRGEKITPFPKMHYLNLHLKLFENEEPRFKLL